MSNRPDESALEELLSRPTPPLVDVMRHLDGDILVLGVAGKMGPSLVRLALRASRDGGVQRRVIGLARFTDPAVRQALERDGIATLECDLFDRDQVTSLPDVPNVIYMVGQKFGTQDDQPRTWAVNAYLAAVVSLRFPKSRIVAFSSGNVYPFWPARSQGPAEADPVGPVGEYAQSVLARERLFEFFSKRFGIEVAILRLNYAIEPRYGVLRDIADRVRDGRPVDLAMGYANLIWQPDANAIALRCLERCASPPFVLNVTGPKVSVRWIAGQFGRRFRIEPVFQGTEAETALLSDATRCAELFGPQMVGIQAMIDQVARWVELGGRSLGKPTHFEERAGRF